MTEYALGSWDRVSINEIWEKCEIKWKKCYVKRCKCKPKFMVFVDDGAPKLSRLWADVCPKHLALAVERGWEYNRKQQKRLKK